MTTTTVKTTITFNDKVVRQFMWASVLWGVVGMLVVTFRMERPRAVRDRSPALPILIAEPAL